MPCTMKHLALVAEEIQLSCLKTAAMAVVLPWRLWAQHCRRCLFAFLQRQKCRLRQALLLCFQVVQLLSAMTLAKMISCQTFMIKFKNGTALSFGSEVIIRKGWAVICVLRTRLIANETQTYMLVSFQLVSHVWWVFTISCPRPSHFIFCKGDLEMLNNPYPRALQVLLSARISTLLFVVCSGRYYKQHVLMWRRTTFKVPLASTVAWALWANDRSRRCRHLSQDYLPRWTRRRFSILVQGHLTQGACYVLHNRLQTSCHPLPVFLGECLSSTLKIGLWGFQKCIQHPFWLILITQKIESRWNYMMSLWAVPFLASSGSPCPLSTMLRCTLLSQWCRWQPSHTLQTQHHPKLFLPT